MTKKIITESEMILNPDGSIFLTGSEGVPIYG